MVAVGEGERGLTLTIFSRDGAHGLMMMLLRMRMMRVLWTDALVRMRCYVVFRWKEVSRILYIKRSRWRHCCGRQWRSDAVGAIAGVICLTSAAAAITARDTANTAGR